MKKIIWFILNYLRLSDIFQLKLSSYLIDTGWFRSFYKNSSVDRFNKPIPWLSYPMIAFLAPRLNKTMQVFEYGSGNSTEWFAERVDSVISLEHDIAWYNKLNGSLPPNTSLVFRELNENGDYPKYISQTGKKFDLVLIDGRERVNCTKNAVNSLTNRGVIVFDNSNVEKYKEALDFLKELGFKRIDFHGIGPIKTISTCTTVFYKEGNCLGI